MLFSIEWAGIVLEAIEPPLSSEVMKTENITARKANQAIVSIGHGARDTSIPTQPRLRSAPILPHTNEEAVHKEQKKSFAPH